VEGGTVKRNPRFLKKSRPQAVIGWRLTVEVFAIFQSNLGVIGNNLIFSRSLEEKNIPEGNASKVFELLPSLNVVLQLIFLLVDKDVDSMFFVHKTS
jgi:hypothetical protein